MRDIQDRILGAFSYEKYVAGQRCREGNLTEVYLRYLYEDRNLEREDYADFKTTIKDVFDRGMCLISIDFEALEGTNKITEVGVSVYDPWNSKGGLLPFIQLVHVIIRENQHLYNRNYVPNHKENFNGGRSLVMGLQEVADSILKLIARNSFQELPPGLGVCIVGHGLTNDLKWLQQMGVDIGNADTIDTQELLCYTHGHKKASLEHALRLVRQPFAFLHNAGNDAYYTLLLCLCLSDPFYRVQSQIDQPERMEYFKCRQPNQDTNVSLFFNGDEYQFQKYLTNQPI